MGGSLFSSLLFRHLVFREFSRSKCDARNTSRYRHGQSLTPGKRSKPSVFSPSSPEKVNVFATTCFRNLGGKHDFQPHLRTLRSAPVASRPLSSPTSTRRSELRFRSRMIWWRRTPARLPGCRRQDRARSQTLVRFLRRTSQAGRISATDRQVGGSIPDRVGIASVALGCKRSAPNVTET